MNSQTEVFGQLLAEVCEKAENEQDITLDEMMEELKVKLSVIVQKESCK